MPSGGVAFYNCGPHSGRSQPHKHLQVGQVHTSIVCVRCDEREVDAEPLRVHAVFSHLQIVPLPFHTEGPTRMPLEGLVDQAVQAAHAGQYEAVEVRTVPYRCFAARLSSSLESKRCECNCDLPE